MTDFELPKQDVYDPVQRRVPRCERLDRCDGDPACPVFTQSSACLDAWLSAENSE